MKSKIKLIMLIAFFTISSSECYRDYEEEDNTITVYVTVSGTIRSKDSKTGEETNCPEILHNKTIRVDIGKAGAMGYDFDLKIDNNGNFTSNGQSLVYQPIFKEQPTEASAYLESVPDGYTQYRAFDILTWDELSSYVNFGESYTWHAFLNVILVLD